MHLTQWKDSTLWDLCKNFVWRSSGLVLSDYIYICIQFRKEMGYWPDLKHPSTFNEKLNWIKLYDRQPLYIQMVDKYDVRDYVAQKVGIRHLNKIIGVYSTVDEIDPNVLPNAFALKATHGSGWNILCKDREKLDWTVAKDQMRRWLKRNHFWYGREWAYYNLAPRIICEEYLYSENGQPPVDYKIFCFHGEPRLIQVDVDRFCDHKRDFYDPEWQRMDLQMTFPPIGRLLHRPKQLDLILDIARRLSVDVPFVRTDLYEVQEKVVFGELTLYPGAGWEPFNDLSVDKQLGSWIHLTSQN